MAKILIESVRKPGRTKRVDGRLADALIRHGGWRYVDAGPAPVAAKAPAPVPYAERKFNELRKIANERGLRLGRATRDELITALEQSDHPGRYQRRDMRAEG